jgi:membrane protease YdiL (CAAX protease family)
MIIKAVKISSMLKIVLTIGMIWIILTVANYSSVISYSARLRSVLDLIIYIIVIYSLILLLRKGKHDVEASLNIRTISFREIPLISLIGIGLVMWSIGIEPLLAKLLPFDSLIRLFQFESPEEPFDRAVFAVELLVLAPILEEFIFRGLLQNSISASYGLRWGIFIPSVIFALLHIVPHVIVIVLLSSFIYGYIVHITRSVLSGIILHSISNGIAIIVMLVAEDFDPMDYSLKYVICFTLISVGGSITVLVTRKLKSMAMC